MLFSYHFKYLFKSDHRYARFQSLALSCPESGRMFETGALICWKWRSAVTEQLLNHFGNELLP